MKCPDCTLVLPGLKYSSCSICKELRCIRHLLLHFKEHMKSLEMHKAALKQGEFHA